MKVQGQQIVYDKQDGSVYQYLIDAEWIKSWRDFINDTSGDHPMPGPIENSKLARKIQSQRKAKGYRFHDNSVELILDGDKNV